MGSKITIKFDKDGGIHISTRMKEENFGPHLLDAHASLTAFITELLDTSNEAVLKEIFNNSITAGINMAKQTKESNDTKTSANPKRKEE